MASSIITAPVPIEPELFSVAQLRPWLIFDVRQQTIFMDHERFKNVAAGVQSILISIAVVVGGIWSAYTFTALRSADEAKVKLQALTDPSLSMSIETERTKSARGKRIGLIVSVKIENTGGRAIQLDLRNRADPPLKVVLVERGENGELQAKRTYAATYYQDINEKSFSIISILDVLPKAKKIISYFVEVDEPGTYFIRLKAPSGKIGEEMNARSKLTPKDVIGETGFTYVGDHWITTTYVDVQ